MSAIAKVKRTDYGDWEVVDLRTGKVVKRFIESGRQASAYAEYYAQEVEKAEQFMKGLENA